MANYLTLVEQLSTAVEQLNQVLKTPYLNC